MVGGEILRFIALKPNYRDYAAGRGHVRRAVDHFLEVGLQQIRYTG